MNNFSEIIEGLCSYLYAYLVARIWGVIHYIGTVQESRSSIYRSFLYYPLLPVCYPYPFRGYYLY